VALTALLAMQCAENIVDHCFVLSSSYAQHPDAVRRRACAAVIMWPLLAIFVRNVPTHCFIVSRGFAPHPVLHRVVQVGLQFFMASVVYVYMYVCTRHVCQLLLHVCTTLGAG
jgi:hypothetical protein